jgi:hypothetical protein
MIMKKLHLLSILVLFLGLSSCEQNLIDAAQPKPSKTPKQARARLMAVPKWTIDEAYENGKIIYQNGVNSSNDSDIDVDYVRFREDGVFEVVYKKEPEDANLRWSMDEAKKTISLYDADNKDYREDWTIETGSVYENAFSMSYEYDYNEYINGTLTKTERRKFTLKMKVKE